MDHENNTKKELIREKDPFKVSLSPKGKPLQISKSDFGLNKKIANPVQQGNT